MSKISIPEPCHENWAEFTPTEKGAFCGSCQIDVIDFSNKSPNEIKSILHENAGKHMCGRFKKTQLVQLNDDFFAWQHQSAKSLQSKFLYACLIVFGMTLFTGCESNQHVVGELYFEEPTEQIQEPALPSNSNIEEEAPIEEYNGHKKGKIKYTPTSEETTKNCEIEPINEEQDFTKGDVLFIPEEEEELFLGQPVVHHVEPIEPDSLKIQKEIIMGRFAAEPIEPVIPETVLFTDEMVDGGLMIDPEYFDFLEDTTDAVKQPETTYSLENIELSPDFQGVLFPNPTSDQAKFQLQVNHTGMFDIYLYAIDGKKIKTIYNGNLSEGLREFSINLRPYESGSYLLIINSEKQKDSFKIEKVK